MFINIVLVPLSLTLNNYSLYSNQEKQHFLGFDSTKNRYLVAIDLSKVSNKSSRTVSMDVV